MITVLSGIVPNEDLIGSEGYTVFGKYTDFEEFKRCISSLPFCEKPSPFVGFCVNGIFYDNNLNELGDFKKAWCGLEGE